MPTILSRQPCRLALLATLSLLTAACVDKPPPPAPPPEPRFQEQALDDYAAQLQAAHPNLITATAPSRRTANVPETYETDFIAQPDILLASHSVEAHERITREWTKVFCTPELQAVLTKQNIAVVLGVLKDSYATRQHIASCVAPSAPTQNDLPSLQGVGGFTAADICRAGLAVGFGRDVKIMKATERNKYVQIDYRRPTDDKPFSFRCRLVDSYILTWDNRAQGPRWYGDQANDWKTQFSVSHNRLRIRTFRGMATTPDQNRAFTKQELQVQVAKTSTPQ